MGYKYDIFISYKRNEKTLKWIRGEFYPILLENLQEYYEDKVRIFFDDNLQDGAVPKPAVEDALKCSKIIVPILSPPYFASRWCCSEWNTFERRDNITGLIDGIYSLRVPISIRDCEEYGEKMGPTAPIPRVFKQYNLYGEGWRRSDDYHLFSRDMNDLADTLYQRLVRVKEHDETWPLVSYEDAGPLCPAMCPSLYTQPRL